MGKLLILVGILFGVAGFVALGIGFADTMSGAVNTASEATHTDENAAELCEPGESLEKDSGASVYTPGQGYGRSVRYFCVDEGGTRREVTGEVATDLLEDTEDLLGGLPLMLLGGLGTSAGIILAVVGLVMVAMRRRGGSLGRPRYGVTRQVITLTPGQEGSQGEALPPEVGALIQQMQSLKASLPPTGEMTDVEMRLRKLQALRDSAMITADEYERLRKQILGL